MILEEVVTNRAVRGLVLLRSKGVDPRNHIDEPEMLNINSPCGCVLGRIYGSFYRGLEELGLVDDTCGPLVAEAPEPPDDKVASYYGFCLNIKEYKEYGVWGYELLTGAWIEVLTHARVAPETSPVVE